MLLAKSKFLYSNVSTFLLSSIDNITKFHLHLVFCICHIVKGWRGILIYFKNYHCCWQSGRGHYPADAVEDADVKLKDPHISVPKLHFRFQNYTERENQNANRLNLILR